MKTSTGTATKAQKARWNRFQEIGCICCWQLGIYSQPEVQHMLSGNRRIGHDATIPLCPFHHRAVKTPGWEKLGPSLADGSKPFRARFGSDERLLAMTDDLLERRGELA